MDKKDLEKIQLPDKDFEKVLSYIPEKEAPQFSRFLRLTKLNKEQAKRLIDALLVNLKKDNDIDSINNYICLFFTSFLNEEVYHYYIDKLIENIDAVIDSIKFWSCSRLPNLAAFTVPPEEYEGSFFKKEDIRFIEILTNSADDLEEIFPDTLLITERVAIAKYNAAISRLIPGDILDEYKLPLPKGNRKEDK